MREVAESHPLSVTHVPPTAEFEFVLEVYDVIERTINDVQHTLGLVQTLVITQSSPNMLRPPGCCCACLSPRAHTRAVSTRPATFSPSCATSVCCMVRLVLGVGVSFPEVW